MNKYNSIVCVTHVWSDGASQAYKKYLLNKKIKKFLWVAHPLFYDERLNGSGYEFYTNGSLNRKKYNQIKKNIELINYFYSFIKTILILLNIKNKFELYIGFNNLNALAGIFLKKIGKVEKCVYHVTDFVPKRFENKILNFIYHKIDSYCAINCDETWNLSYRMVEARSKLKKIDASKCGIQRELQMGAWIDYKKHVEWNRIKTKQIVFMGHLLKKQGVQYILDAIPLIKKKIPSIHFLIIGTGEYESKLKEKIKKLKIEENVTFVGFVDDHNELERMVSESALALAPYEVGDYDRNWTYYTDPGKIKVYLGSGVPVLLTEVAHNAKEIENCGCGKIIKTNNNDIALKVIELLSDKESLKFFRKNCFRFIEKYNWNKILDEVFLN